MNIKDMKMMIQKNCSFKKKISNNRIKKLVSMVIALTFISTTAYAGAMGGFPDEDTIKSINKK